jgi:small-conductance mechanosensitive channel
MSGILRLALCVTGGLLFAVGAGAQDLGAAPDISNLAVISETINWGGVTAAIFLIFFAFLALRFVDNLVEELGEAFNERRMLFQRANAFFRFFVYISTFVGSILLSIEFSDEVLALLGGGVVVAVGFATRDLLASIVAGVMIIFDRPFQVGDRVSFAGKYGDVLQIGLRSVKLRTLDDSIVTIPNNLLLSEVSSSGNFGVLDMQIDVDFYIGIDQDAALARSLVLEVAAVSRFIYLPKPVRVQVEQVQLEMGPAIRVRMKAYVLDTRYEKDFVTDVTLRVHEVFAEYGILPPAILHRDIESLRRDLQLR